MNEAIAVSAIARLIQLSIAPVFLLAGVGAILNVLANRLARVVDRVRRLEEEFAGASPVRQRLARSELKRLAKRMQLVNWSITACTASALSICLVVAVMFVGGLGEIGVGRVIAALFVLAMGLLTAALILFLLEVRMASRTLRVRYELLEEDMAAPPR
jgi:TM2 domain-containing membrane protein YozV